MVSYRQASCSEDHREDMFRPSDLSDTKERDWSKLPSEIRCCVKVEVGVLGSPPLTVLMVSVDVKHH